MDTLQRNIISEIRGFNRFYTDLLGLLNKHILNSPYSLTEARVLFEIDKIRHCTANTLTERLDIDKGYLSRILNRFELDKLIKKEISHFDRRALVLTLTQTGRETLSLLEDKSSEQIIKMIKHLSVDEQLYLAETMKNIRNTLMNGFSPITIRTFRPTDIEVIVKRHREIYEAEYGFGSEFGDYVEKYINEFNKSFDDAKENMWVAEENGEFVGVIAVVHADDRNAQLRWFVIEPKFRGGGLGRRLMQTAINFCRLKNYRHVFLWTVSTLEAARYLYRNYGFILNETKANNTWGKHLTEERWELDL